MLRWFESIPVPPRVDKITKRATTLRQCIGKLITVIKLADVWEADLTVIKIQETMNGGQNGASDQESGRHSGN
mgnify:CR=1 FL=1